MSERLRKLFQFRIRDLLILIALIGGIGGWLLMQHMEKQRELMIVDQVLGLSERGIPSEYSYPEGDFYAIRFSDEQAPGWNDKGTIYVGYTGPAFLRYYVEYYFPDQPTIFHRIVKFQFDASGVNATNLPPLSQLRELKVIRFYKRSFEKIDTVKSIMPGWEPRKMDKQNEEFNGNWFGIFHLHRKPDKIFDPVG